MTDDLVSVRYVVDDLQAAIRFYTKHLGFSELTNFAPAFADVVRGNRARRRAGRARRPFRQPDRAVSTCRSSAAALSFAAP